jgi:hypothetical protein
MTSPDELRRLQKGPRSDEDPGGIGTVTLVGLCRMNAPEVAERCRNVLTVVLSSRVDAEAPLHHWDTSLPSWFVQACAPEMTLQEMERWLEEWRAMTPEQKRISGQSERWSLANWLHWFQPSERQWEFWDCQAEPGMVRLRLQLDAWPFTHGALDWLLRAAGAHHVISEEGS